MSDKFMRLVQENNDLPILIRKADVATVRLAPTGVIPPGTRPATVVEIRMHSGAAYTVTAAYEDVAQDVDPTEEE